MINNTGASSSAQTFTGTTGVDNFTGASGDDTFSFTTTGTLNDTDVVEGGTGTDSLTVTNGAATLTPNIENVENLIITPTGNITANLANTASTFSKLELASGSTFNLVINDVAAIPGVLKLTNSAGDLTLNLKAAAVAGTSDVVAIELAGAQAASTITITDDSATAAIEGVTIHSGAAANTLADLVGARGSITVTGDQSLTLTSATEATVTTIDASGMNGALGLTMSASHGSALGAHIMGSPGVDSLTDGNAATSVDTISAGAGNDTITMTQYLPTDVIDGGDGVDTVSLTNTAIVSSTLGGLSNVEVVYTPTDNTTLTLGSNTGPATFSLGTVDSTGTIYFNDDYDQASTVIITGDADSDDTIVNNSGIALTVKGNSADFAANITVITGHATAVDTLEITPTGAGDLGTVATQISGIDNVTFVRPASGVSTATTMDFGDFATPVTIDASALTALDGALTLDLSGGGTVTGTINYTGGAMGDIITLGTLNDTLDSGAGADSITSGTGINTITTGAGIDTVMMGTGGDIISAGAGNDIISAGASDFLANDVIDGGDGTDTLVYAATAITDESIFSGISNIERIKFVDDELTGSPTTGTEGTMAVNGNIPGNPIFDASGVNDTEITLSTGVTDHITVDLGLDVTSNADEVYNGGATTSANTTLTVTASDADAIDATTVLTGSTTATDTLTITSLATGGTADLDAVTNFDVINVIDYANGADVTITDNNNGTNGGIPLTINATTLDAGEVLTVDTDNFGATAGVTVNAGGGADIITTGDGADIITGGAGIDTIDGTGNATTAADSIYAGAGNDIINVTTAETEFSNSSTTALITDTVDGGAGTDNITI